MEDTEVNQQLQLKYEKQKSTLVRNITFGKEFPECESH